MAFTQTVMPMDIQTTNSHPSRLSSTFVEKYYLNEEYADFHFLLKVNKGKYKRVPAHKLILAESDVFRTMFNGDWKEMNEAVIDDTSPAVFKEFLKCFYLREMILTMENVGFVMNLGKKYNVPECLTVCGKFITDSITEDNVCTAYGLATFFDQEKLRRYCELLIGTNTKAVLSSNDFLECDRKVLKSILDLDCISCSEVDVLEACMNWVKFKSGHDQLTREIVQEQLGELIKEIRFKSISPQEYAMLLPTYIKLFSVDEIVDINKLVLLDGFNSNLFSEKKRKSIDSFEHDGMTIRCDRGISRWISAMPYKVKEVEVTTFSVNEPVLLQGIECATITKHENNSYTSLTEKLATELEIAQVSEQSGEQILYNQKSNYEPKFITVITLSKPILIRPNLMYEIRLKQSPQANHATGAQLKSEVQMDSNITVTFHRDPTIEGDTVARGLIRNLVFKKI